MRNTKGRSIGPVAYSEVIDRDPTKTIWETHKKHSYEESKKLFEKILKKMGWGAIEEDVVRPAALILTKR